MSKEHVEHGKGISNMELASFCKSCYDDLIDIAIKRTKDGKVSLRCNLEGHYEGVMSRTIEDVENHIIQEYPDARVVNLSDGAMIVELNPGKAFRDLPKGFFRGWAKSGSDLQWQFGNLVQE